MTTTANIKSSKQSRRFTWAPGIGMEVVNKQLGEGIIIATGPLNNDIELTVAFWTVGVGIKTFKMSDNALYKLEVQR